MQVNVVQGSSTRTWHLECCTQPIKSVRPYYNPHITFSRSIESAVRQKSLYRSLHRHKKGSMIIKYLYGDEKGPVRPIRILANTLFFGSDEQMNSRMLHENLYHFHEYWRGSWFLPKRKWFMMTSTTSSDDIQGRDFLDWANFYNKTHNQTICA